MRPNRIKELRHERGLTVTALADLTGLSHTHISRMENGQRGLSIDIAERIAQVMNTTAQDVMGLNSVGQTPVHAGGMAEDVTPYDDGIANLPVRARSDVNVSPWMVKTNVLDKAGLRAGAVVFVDVSADAVARLKPLQCVVAQIYDDENLTKATTVIRQFVPPSLLITNSSGPNSTPLDIDRGEAYIKGVVVGHYHAA